MQEKNITPRLRLQPSEHRFILILGDITAAVLALFIALYLWSTGAAWMNFSMEFLRTRPDAWFYFLPGIWIALMVDNYDLNKAGSLKLTLKAIGRQLSWLPSFT
jgi:hypothetical protein